MTPDRSAFDAMVAAVDAAWDAVGRCGHLDEIAVAAVLRALPDVASPHCVDALYIGDWWEACTDTTEVVRIVLDSLAGLVPE